MINFEGEALFGRFKKLNSFKNVDEKSGETSMSYSYLVIVDFTAEYRNLVRIYMPKGIVPDELEEMHKYAFPVVSYDKKDGSKGYRLQENVDPYHISEAS
ncbi:MAG: hypothetical protein K0U74_12160 [Alphaproteobacteria bacterium]|nr:hypothetical protein [Alphaproteobacteria bacterium]